MVVEKVIRHFKCGDVRIDIHTEFSEGMNKNVHKAVIKGSNHGSPYERTEHFIKDETVEEFLSKHFREGLFKTGFTKSILIAKSVPEPVLDVKNIW